MWLIKLHQKYLFNKINILIISFVILLSFIIGIIIINPFLNDATSWMYRFSINSNFNQAYLIFLKIIMILISSYLFCMNFSKTGDNYSVIITCKTSKNKYFLSKIVVINKMLLLFIMIFLINYNIVGFIFSRWFIFDISILIQFMEVYIISLCYGYLSIILIRLFKNLYVLLLPISLYILSEILIEYLNLSFFVKIIEIFLPTTHIINDKVTSVYGILHLIILSSFYLLFSGIFYIRIKE